jgi:hypothetical protein
MADAKPREGSWYKLKADYGTGHGLIPAASQCQVTHIFPAGTPGVGTTDEAIIVRFMEESSVTGRVVQRRFTLRKTDFGGMFSAGAEPKELKRWDDAQAVNAAGV